LPGESAEAYEERKQKWMKDCNPQSERARYYVERAVLATWRMDRAVAAEEALALRKMNEIVDGEEHRQAEAVAQLTARLEEDPGLIRQLQRIPAGARWIRAQYLILQRYVESNSCLLSSQRYMAITLLGKRMSDAFRGDPLVAQWLVALLGASHGSGGINPDQIKSIFGRHRLEQMSDVEFDRRVERFLSLLPEKPEGKAMLEAYIADAIAKLDEQIELLDALAARDQAIALQNARVDLGVEGQRLQKYEKGHEGSHFAMLKGFDKLQNATCPDPGPQRGSGRAEARAAAGGAGGGPPSAAAEERTEFPDGVATASDGNATGSGVESSPDPDLGAVTSEPISDDPTTPATSPVPAAPALAAQAPAPVPDTEPAEDPGAKTSEDIPIEEPTEDELASYAPEMVALQKLQFKLDRIYGAGRDRGANTSEAIFPQPPPSGPTPGEVVRAPPGGGGAATT
jgi:hypothetical protein